MDIEIKAPPEIIAAFNSGDCRRSAGWYETYCVVCDPDHRRRGRRTLRAGIFRGRPWWGCMRCHCEKDFAAARRTAWLRLQNDATSTAADERRLRERAMQIWEQSSELRLGDPGDLYLRRRCITPVGSCWSHELHRHPRVWHSETKRHYDALVAPVRNVANGFIALMRIYVMPDGRRADDPSLPRELRVIQAKKAIGSVRGGAVRLGLDSNADTLGIAEGIESALALSMRLQLPCWSTISSGGMKNLQLPKDIRRVIIGPDIGDPGGKNGRGKHEGMKAAIALRERLLAEAKKDGRRLVVELKVPPVNERGDWADWAKQAASL
jgi:putative DNA primase/helicase